MSIAIDTPEEAVLLYTQLPEAEWHPVADQMGIRKRVEGSGYEAAQRMLTKSASAADVKGEAFSTEELELLGSHIFSVDVPGEVANRIQNKVVRHARNALRSELGSGGPTTKIGLFAKWPTSWLNDYQAAIEGNCPMLFCGVVQNAFAPTGALWKP